MPAERRKPHTKATREYYDRAVELKKTMSWKQVAREIGAYSHGALASSCMRHVRGQLKLTYDPELVRTVRELTAGDFSARDVAARLGITVNRVYRILGVNRMQDRRTYRTRYLDSVISTLLAETRDVSKIAAELGVSRRVVTASMRRLGVKTRRMEGLDKARVARIRAAHQQEVSP